MSRSNVAVETSETTYGISELADEFDVTPRTIRFYEDKDLIRPARNGMTRVYGRRDRARLALILRGKRLGFSLAEIREMLDLYDLGDGQVEQLRMILRKSRERLAVLQRQRQDIDDAISELNDNCADAEDMLRRKGVRPEAV